MKIVRLANFVTPQSGGLRTALRELGAGYSAAGHTPEMVIPGERDAVEMTRQGRVTTIGGPIVPGTGGYRVLVGRGRLRRLLDSLEPDRLEVSDRTTLRWTGEWARANGVRSMMVSHESLDGILSTFGPGRAVSPIADRLNRASAESYDTVACTTEWAAAEFRRLGVPNLVRTSLGVDLDHFRPARRDQRLREWLAPNGEMLLVHCGRLSAEKRPDISIAALAELRRRQVPAVLVVAGDGPRRRALEARAGRLLVRFLGFVPDRDHVAGLLASADIVLAPGPVETFGLAALEALASGTPVVVNARSALPEVVGAAGEVAEGEGVAFADAVQRLSAQPAGALRRAVGCAQLPDDVAVAVAEAAEVVVHGHRPRHRLEQPFDGT
jgi:alpha-1,6-mannosyltransferase